MTPFTTDVNLFANVQSSAHVEGLERFWKRVQSANSAVSLLTISIVETSSVIQTARMIGDGYDNFRASTASAKMPDRLRVVQCVNDVRRSVRELAEDISGPRNECPPTST